MAYRVRDFQCAVCGAAFSGPFPESRQFCSVGCRQAFRNQPERNPSRSDAARAKIAASRRGKPTTAGRVLPDEQRRNISQALAGRVLSAEHRAAISEGQKRAGNRPPQNAHLVGESHPNWKGGYAAERQKKYRTPEYLAFVKTVLARDSYTCRHCGAKNGQGVNVVLQVHHILSYAEHESLRYAPENGLTLCKPCHYRAGKGLPRATDQTWKGRERVCEHCNQPFRMRCARKYCPTCRAAICCPVCGSTTCAHAARPKLAKNTAPD